jgi:nicotinate phosphoribosyltransferase
MRVSRSSGTIVEEVIFPVGQPPKTDESSRTLTVPMVRAGEPVAVADLAAARTLVASGLKSLPWEGLKLSHGEPAIPTRLIAP